MELPHNTVISRGMKEQGSEAPVADWATKRAWVDYAFQRFEENGYVVSSAYTLVKPSDHSSFVYRDAVWHGADMVGTGVASFSHFGGVHYQNEDQWETYIERVSKGELPIARALEISKRQLLIRQLILQTKTGLLDAAYFRDTFHEEIFDVFSDAFSWVVDQGYGRIDGDEFRLTRAGLLRADAILPKFFETEFRDIRYT
jgi:oxygen-independent coproporphyrinogen-3 oxidase